MVNLGPRPVLRKKSSVSALFSKKEKEKKPKVIDPVTFMTLKILSLDLEDPVKQTQLLYYDALKHGLSLAM